MRRERNTGERCTTVILIAMILWLPGLVSDAAGATAKRRLANVEAVVTPQEGAVGQKFSFKLKYDVINADGGELANVEVVETAVVSGPEVKQLADHVSRVTGLRDKATVRMEEWSAGFSQPGSYQWSYSLDANGFVGTGGIVDFRVTREEQKSPATIAPAPPTTSGNPIVTGSTSHKVLATGATGGVMARKNGGAWQDLKQDLELATGDEIACDPDGEVTLVFSPGPMRCALRPGTQVKVASLRRPQGAVWPALQLSVGEIAVEGSQGLHPEVLVVQAVVDALALVGQDVHVEGDAELADVGQAGGGAGLLLGGAEGGHQDADQQGDDADDDQQLDERERAFPMTVTGPARFVTDPVPPTHAGLPSGSALPTPRSAVEMPGRATL